MSRVLISDTTKKRAILGWHMAHRIVPPCTDVQHSNQDMISHRYIINHYYSTHIQTRLICCSHRKIMPLAFVLFFLKHLFMCNSLNLTSATKLCQYQPMLHQHHKLIQAFTSVAIWKSVLDMAHVTENETYVNVKQYIVRCQITELYAIKC